MGIVAPFHPALLTLYNGLPFSGMQ